MSKIRKTLSSKMRNDGKLQIMLQVIITRTCRPRIKSGVYVNPSLFDQKKGEIIVPKRGKLNLPLWEKAINVQRELNDECNVIERIANAAYGHLENPTSEWIDKVRSYYKLGLLLPHKGYNDVINWESIEKAFEEAKATEEAVKASIVSTPSAFSSLTDIHKIFDYYVYHHKRANTQEPMSKTRRGQYQTLSRLIQRFEHQKYNEYIKEIFRVAGITRLVYWRNPRTDRYELKPINEVASSHMARKTFVGTIYKEVKDPSLISRMSGHSENSKSFSRYRDIDDEDLKEVIGKIG